MRHLVSVSLLGLVVLMPAGCGPTGDSSSVITEAEFQTEVLESEVPVLLDFTADWCPACLELDLGLTEIEDEYAKRLRVIAIDVDSNRDLAYAFGASALPMLVIMHEGDRITTYSGDFSEHSVRFWIETSLKSIEESDTELEGSGDDKPDTNGPQTNKPEEDGEIDAPEAADESDAASA